MCTMKIKSELQGCLILANNKKTKGGKWRFSYNTVNFIENAVGVWKTKNLEPTKDKLTKKGAKIITYETRNASR